MTDPIELTANGFINPIITLPSFVVPVLQNGEGSWVQNIDDSEVVVGFCRCDIAERYILPASPKLLRVGDRPLYGFMFEGGEVILGKREELVQYLRERLLELRQYSFIHADVARFVSDEGELAAAARSSSEIIRELSPAGAYHWIRTILFCRQSGGWDGVAATEFCSDSADAGSDSVRCDKPREC